MDGGIRIRKKGTQRGDDGHRVISVRISEEVIAQLDALAAQTNRSRNELINLLLAISLRYVRVTEDDEE